MTESDRALRARSLLRQAVAAAAVVAFCLLGGAATYMWVNGAPGFLTAGEEEPAAAEAEKPAAGAVPAAPAAAPL